MTSADMNYTDLGLSTELHERLTAAIDWYGADGSYDHDRAARAGLIEGEIRTQVTAEHRDRAEEIVAGILSRHGA
jgi:hypothetical protein